VSRKAGKVRHFGGAFSGVPVEVMKSPAWHWLPSFARDVCFALAAGFRVYRDDRRSNNGSLELTEKAAAGFGISRRELWPGIGLLLLTGIVARTVQAKKRSGRGVPAKYALTWHPVVANAALNLSAEATARRTWVNFEPPGPRPKSVNAAAALLSGKALSGRRNAFSSVTACGPTQSPRAARKPKLQSPRADSKATDTVTACGLPSKNLGHPPPPVVAAAAAAAGGGGGSPVNPQAVEPVSLPSESGRPFSVAQSGEARAAAFLRGGHLLDPRKLAQTFRIPESRAVELLHAERARRAV
jgi:hypothetical protein